MEKMSGIQRVLLMILCLLATLGCTDKTPLPNIVYILADDLGYGDIGAYNPDSKIATPRLDQFASQAMVFTDAHSPSSVCTPTRYGILTGTYCWRSRLKQGVLQGYGQSLIKQEELTVPELLKRHGYTTAVVGKWHLGLDWALLPGMEDSLASLGNQPIITNLPASWIDFHKPPQNGPSTHGFDYSYILPASLDMDPYCYLENDTLTAIPSDTTGGSELNSRATGAFWRPGFKTPDFDFYNVLPTFIARASSFLRMQSVSDQPFFLYVPLPAPHTPWVPAEEFRGTSGAGQYGDFTQMVDKYIGDLLDALEESGKAENTLVIITSDNGPYWKPESIASYGHRSAANFRGMKADAWEGGHRIPFMVRWPGQIVPKTQSDQLTSLTNLMATIADIIGDPLKPGEGRDSRSILGVLKGENADNNHPVIHHSAYGMFAIRKGEWKYIDGLGSGGFSAPRFEEPTEQGPKGQLYNLSLDPGEQLNLAFDSLERAQLFHQMLETIKDSSE